MNQLRNHTKRHKHMSSATLRVLLPLFFLTLLLSPRSDAQLEEWCVADEQTEDDKLLGALNWACGKGGADCSQIQPNMPCYLPNTLKDHASYAFNSYFQKFKHQGGSCHFNAAAMIIGRDPSHGGCKYEYIS